jgi:hypothetical protein
MIPSRKRRREPQGTITFNGDTIAWGEVAAVTGIGWPTKWK